MFGPNKFWVKIFFGKHHLSVTNSFLVGSVIVDLAGVLLVVLVLLVTWGLGQSKFFAENPRWSPM